MLEVAFPADILHRYYPNGKLGGLTLDGASPGALGQIVELVVHVERPAREFTLKGQLAWARHRGSKNLKECYGIDFLGVDDASQRLLGFARQDLDAASMRTHPRMVIELPVRIHHGGVARREYLADLSAGGAYVRSGNPLPVDEVVTLHLRPPGAILAMSIRSRIAWSRSTGSAPGMGLQFLDHDQKLRERLGKLLAQLNGH